MIVQTVLPPTWENGLELELFEACDLFCEPVAAACYDRDLAHIELSSRSSSARLWLWGPAYWTGVASTPMRWVPMRLFYGMRYASVYLGSWCPTHERWTRVGELDTGALLESRGPWILFQHHVCPCVPG